MYRKISNPIILELFLERGLGKILEGKMYCAANITTLQKTFFRRDVFEILRGRGLDKSLHENYKLVKFARCRWMIQFNIHGYFKLVF